MQTPHFSITLEMLNLIAEIEEFRGWWNASKKGLEKRLPAFHKASRIQSIGASIRLSGGRMSNGDIEAILSQGNLFRYSSKDEQDAYGYAQALDYIYSHYMDFPIAESSIKQLHADILKFSQTAGVQQKWGYKVISANANAFNIPNQMTELFGWLEDTLSQKVIHPLLLLPIFIAQFLRIEPFQEANYRIARLFMNHFLLKNGYDYVAYCSLEAHIEDHHKEFHNSFLQNESLTDEFWQEWMVTFLTVLFHHKQDLMRKIETKNLNFHALPTLSVKILELAEQHGRINASEIEDATNANRSTIKIRLRELVAKNQLMKYGQGRATWYSLE